jgi:hypothetical protein
VAAEENQKAANGRPAIARGGPFVRIVQRSTAHDNHMIRPAKQSNAKQSKAKQAKAAALGEQ